MADFSTAYRIVHGNEGGWANTAGDKGGETYMGIARNSHPHWAGWALVDAVKATRALRRGEFINNAELKQLVVNFYRATWNRMLGDGIRSQPVANLYYDFYTNSGGATTVLQRVLVYQFRQRISIDGEPGPQTLAAINAVDGASLHNGLKAARIAYVQDLVRRDPSQGQFLNTWLRRIRQFPDQQKKSSASSPSAASRRGSSIGNMLLSKLRNPFSQTDETATA
jgi:lysozyme family protein